MWKRMIWLESSVKILRYHGGNRDEIVEIGRGSEIEVEIGIAIESEVGSAGDDAVALEVIRGVVDMIDITDQMAVDAIETTVVREDIDRRVHELMTIR